MKFLGFDIILFTTITSTVHLINVFKNIVDIIDWRRETNRLGVLVELKWKNWKAFFWCSGENRKTVEFFVKNFFKQFLKFQKASGVLKKYFYLFFTKEKFSAF